MSFTPVADQSGRATIIVEIEDGGLDGDLNTAGDNATFTRTFDVNISPVNDSPTLDVIVDVTLDEDAAEQTINLAGATAGGGETQPLQITASSSNNTLIPDPVVTYTTPDETGSLAFTPATDQNGTATITVTVEDGGLDGDLNTAGDNATFSRTFDITVNAEELIPGDSNRDGFFDSTDLVQVFQAGEYEDGIPLNSTWETGDWNGDQDFDSTDMVLAFQYGAYENPPAATARFDLRNADVDEAIMDLDQPTAQDLDGELVRDLRADQDRDHTEQESSRTTDESSDDDLNSRDLVFDAARFNLSRGDVDSALMDYDDDDSDWGEEENGEANQLDPWNDSSNI